MNPRPPLTTTRLNKAKRFLPLARAKALWFKNIVFRNMGLIKNFFKPEKAKKAKAETAKKPKSLKKL